MVLTNNRLSLLRRGGLVRTVVPLELPRDYQLELRVTPRESNGLLLGIPIGGRSCMLTIDGFHGFEGGIRTALETIDNRRPHDLGYPGTAKFGQLMKHDVESRLIVRVVGQSMTLTCDGKLVLDWNDDVSRLGVYPLFDAGQPGRMFLASWAARYDLTSVTLQPLDAR